MKNKRQLKILEIIKAEDVQTQEELQNKLTECGFTVTQATVSRDIKELKLIKIARNDGKYKYASSEQSGSGEGSQRFLVLCAQTVLTSDFAENIAVIHCMSGTANALCACLDTLGESGLVGTIAGDDTIFVLFRFSAAAESFSSRINKIIAG